MVDENIRDVLRKHFSRGEVERILKFLDQGFSKNGEIVVCSVFLYAYEHGKSLDEVFIVLKREWDRNWYYQHPDIKGDADAPGAAGIQNRASLENVYNALGIPSPFSMKRPENTDRGLRTRKLDPGTIVRVHTRNSVYVLTFDDPKNDLVRFHGGRYFPQETRGKFMGSEVAGGILEGFIQKGASLWICHDAARSDGNLRTSTIRDYEVVVSPHNRKPSL